MSFSMAPLLVHSDAVPVAAKEALRAAFAVPVRERGDALERAARVLHRETDLDCPDVRELFGLSPGTCS